LVVLVVIVIVGSFKGFKGCKALIALKGNFPKEINTEKHRLIPKTFD
jgi:hypothetical protein